MVVIVLGVTGELRRGSREAGTVLLCSDASEARQSRGWLVAIWEEEKRGGRRASPASAQRTSRRLAGGGTRQWFYALRGERPERRESSGGRSSLSTCGDSGLAAQRAGRSAERATEQVLPAALKGKGDGSEPKLGDAEENGIFPAIALFPIDRTVRETFWS